MASLASPKTKASRVVSESYANSEIIVVDNGSSDGSRSSRPRVTSLLPPRSTGSRVSLWISAWTA